MVTWNDEITDRLKALWNKGLSSGKTAAALSREFGVEISRNAVIGKVGRLGLERSDHTKALNRARGQIPPHRRRTTAAASTKPVAAAPKLLKSGMFASGDGIPTEPLPKEESPTDYAKLYSVKELEPHHCRWPIGDPKSESFGFCGRQKVPGHSYCAGHCARAYALPVIKPRAPKPEVIPTFADMEDV